MKPISSTDCQGSGSGGLLTGDFVAIPATKMNVKLDLHEAKAMFDDAKESAVALTRATKDAGYQSNVVGSAK